MRAAIARQEHLVPDSNQKFVMMHDMSGQFIQAIFLTEDKVQAAGQGEYEVKTAYVKQGLAHTPKFGRVVEGVYDRDKIDEAIQVSHSILPLVRQQPGFVGVFLFVDPASGSNFSISIWEKEEDSAFNIGSGWWREQVDKFKYIYLEEPTTRSCMIRLGGY